jgi:hypothetical protein
MPSGYLLAAVLILLASLQDAAARPAAIAQIDAGKLKGVPSQLAWSDDNTQLFLQLAERDSDGKVRKTHAFVLTLADPALTPIDEAPDWATRYWSWKSYKTPPNAEGPEITVSQEMRPRVMSESAMGGSVGQSGGGIDNMGGTGTSIDAVAMRAQQQAKMPATVLRLKDEVVGQFVGTPPVPGITFGWAPAMPARLAYGNTAGHLAIIDGQGRKQEVAGTKNVSLPAWSNDGSKIAFVTMTGKNKYDVCVVDAR